MKENFYSDWLRLSNEDRLAVFQETANRKGLPAAVIEKDWWVTLTLRIIFNMDLGPHLLFKGGTSLSKGWNLIDRFSEDIDIIVDSGFLGFPGAISNRKVNKLKLASLEYVTNTFFEDLQSAFEKFGITNMKFSISEKSVTHKDPIQIDIEYEPITKKVEYIQTRVQVEIGCRSLRDPFSEREIVSFVGSEFSDRDFADPHMSIPCVNPERTFLEKIFLLHEEFQRPIEKVRVDRLSRHLYDLTKIMSTEYSDLAFQDMKLYEKIVKHRKKFFKVGGVDYEKHQPKFINLIPPDHIYSDWKNDYNSMKENMIYSESPSFEDLMSKIKSLQLRINQLEA